MKLSANEETLCHDDVRRRPSGFIMHTAQGGTDLGACASKVSPTAETSRRRMVYRMNYSYLYKIKADKKSCQLKLAAVEWPLLWSYDKLGVADWITSAQNHADSVNLLKETEKKKLFCSLPVKYFATLFPDCTK